MPASKLPPALLLAAALAAGSAAEAHVFNGVGYPVYGFSTTPTSQAAQVSLGFTFSVTEPTLVGGLGYWDQGGDGFLTPHDVGIFLGDGATIQGPLLLSATLAAGMSGTLVPGGAWADPTMAPSGFRYERTSSLLLLPGQDYTIAGLSPTLGDPWVYGGPSETTGFVSGAAVRGLDYAKHVYIGPNAARISFDTPTLADPSDHYGDYQFYAVNFIAMPEPASWVLIVAGFGSLGAVLRQRRSRAARTV